MPSEVERPHDRQVSLFYLDPPYGSSPTRNALEKYYGKLQGKVTVLQPQRIISPLEARTLVSAISPWSSPLVRHRAKRRWQ